MQLSGRIATVTDFGSISNRWRFHSLHWSSCHQFKSDSMCSKKHNNDDVEDNKTDRQTGTKCIHILQGTISIKWLPLNEYFKEPFGLFSVAPIEYIRTLKIDVNCRKVIEFNKVSLFILVCIQPYKINWFQMGFFVCLFVGFFFLIDVKSVDVFAQFVAVAFFMLI